MKLVELLEYYSERLRENRDGAPARGLDAPLTASSGRLLETAGTLHLYRFELASECPLMEDTPVTVLPSDNLEPTEGFIVGIQERTVWVQTFDAFGKTIGSCTLVPDTSGFFEMASKRLAAMAKHPERYTLGPAERLAPWLDPELSGDSRASMLTASTAVLTTSWGDDLTARRTKLVSLVNQLVRENKRLLVLSADHRASDEVAGSIAKAMRASALQFKSLVCRYEMPLLQDASGMPLFDLGFEAQIHRFYAKSRSEQDALRRKYERFRELTPLLAYKAEKQRDLNEVRLLEWRLVTQLTDLQAKIKEIDQTLADYEQLPLWKRLSMQARGKNVVSLGEYRTLHEAQSVTTKKELDVAKARIEELKPEAAIPKDLKPEYEELKEDVVRLGGTKKIRELLAAGEGANRQAFIQNRRVVGATAARVMTDPLFERVRFDVLLVDEAPRIPAPYLLAAAGLVRERIIVSADQREVPDAAHWSAIQPAHTGHSSVA